MGRVTEGLQWSGIGYQKQRSFCPIEVPFEGEPDRLMTVEEVRHAVTEERNRSSRVTIIPVEGTAWAFNGKTKLWFHENRMKVRGPGESLSAQ